MGSGREANSGLASLPLRLHTYGERNPFCLPREKARFAKGLALLCSNCPRMIHAEPA